MRPESQQQVEQPPRLSVALRKREMEKQLRRSGMSWKEAAAEVARLAREGYFDGDRSSS